MTMKLPLTALSLLIPAVCTTALLPGAAVPASAAATALSPAFSYMKGIAGTPSFPVLKVHSAMHSNCANHHGSYHKHVYVTRMRHCAEWAATGSSSGPTRRICTRWVTRPVRRPYYKMIRCSR